MHIVFSFDWYLTIYSVWNPHPSDGLNQIMVRINVMTKNLVKWTLAEQYFTTSYPVCKTFRKFGTDVIVPDDLLSSLLPFLKKYQWNWLSVSYQQYAVLNILTIPYTVKASQVIHSINNEFSVFVFVCARACMHISANVHMKHIYIYMWCMYIYRQQNEWYEQSLKSLNSVLTYIRTKEMHLLPTSV